MSGRIRTPRLGPVKYVNHDLQTRQLPLNSFAKLKTDRTPLVTRLDL